jgi:HSP20 family protein
MKVDNGLVTVSSQKEAEKLSENSQFTRREFGLGTFERSFSIPKSIDTDKISAHFNNGILSIALPKREESLPKPARSVEIL